MSASDSAWCFVAETPTKIARGRLENPPHTDNSARYCNFASSSK
jgi:hypothetical protein